MGDFDPKAFLAEGAAPATSSSSAPSFDPKAFLSESTSESPAPPSKLESLARGAIQGATLSWGDEIGAALESAFTSKTYRAAVTENRANNARAKEENPWSYGAGEVGAGIALGAATGGAGLAARTGLAAGKAATYTNAGLTGLRAATTTGAALGAISGAGAAEGGIGDTLEKALTGGVIGAASGGIANKAFGKSAISTVDKIAEPASKSSAARDVILGAGGHLVGGLPGVGTAVVAGKVASKGAKLASEALAGLVRASRSGDLEKRAVLKAIEGGVSVGAAMGIVNGLKNRPSWADEIGAVE